MVVERGEKLVGPIEWEMKGHGIESRGKGATYMEKTREDKLDWPRVSQKLSYQTRYWRKAGKDTKTRKRRKQLFNDLREKGGYWKLKEEALDGTTWGTRFGRVYDTDARQSRTLRINETGRTKKTSRIIFISAHTSVYLGLHVIALWNKIRISLAFSLHSDFRVYYDSDVMLGRETFFKE